MFFSYHTPRQPFQRFHLHLRAAQLTESFFRCVHFQMSVCGAKSGFQLSEICGSEQMAHFLPHGVAQVGSIGKRLPR